MELLYFKIADKCNIIDKPNERSSHSSVVLRGGGIIFALSVIVWATYSVLSGSMGSSGLGDYLPFLVGLVLIAGVSFVDDIISLPDSVRLVVHFVSYGLMFWSLGIYGLFGEYGVWAGIGILVLALIVCVGATNVINFMDGINGITAGYSLAVLVPIGVLNSSRFQVPGSRFQVSGGFIEPSFLWVVMLAVLVFAFFNFRQRGKAKCFAGDVGSIGIAFILLFALGRLILTTGDITYLIFLLVYGVDGCLTICHRILLHENLGEAHRKHAYQLMANELKLSHPLVSGIYMFLQLAVSLGFIYLCPNTVGAHWLYLIGAFIVLAVAYVLFKKKYYHLHEEYLKTLKK